MSVAVGNEHGIMTGFFYFKDSAARLLLPHVKKENVSSANKNGI
jgi:hypothetical protein